MTRRALCEWTSCELDRVAAFSLLRQRLRVLPVLLSHSTDYFIITVIFIIIKHSFCLQFCPVQWKDHKDVLIILF